MKRNLLFVLVAIGLFLSACRNNSPSVSEQKQNNTLPEKTQDIEMTDIPYALAKNYFVRSGAQIPSNPKIETAEQFNEIFGMATTMGPGGRPTDIDFSKNFVLAVVKPETDRAVVLKPLHLRKNKAGEIIMTYQFTEGEKQSYRSVPHFALVVSKTETGPIQMAETN